MKSAKSKIKNPVILLLLLGLAACSGTKKEYAELPGMILYYSFDGNCNDLSGGGNDGLLVGPDFVSDRHGRAHCACYLDGIDDYISFGYDARLTEFPISLSFWIKPEEVGKALFGTDVSSKRSSGISVSFGTQEDTYHRIALNVGNGDHIGPENRKTFVADRELFRDSLYYVAGIIHDVDRMEIYINGKLMPCFTRGEGSSYSYVTGKGVIGFASDYINYYKGVIDDLRIFNRALSEEEILLLFRE